MPILICRFGFPCLALALALSLPASGQSPPGTGETATNRGEIITPERICALRSVRAAVISPDGAHVAYTLRIPRDLTDGDDGLPWVELHVVDVGDAATSRGYIVGQVNVSDVAWRPDGAAISFRAKRGDDEYQGIYSIPLDGGEAERIVSHGADIGEYAWSPDGRRIAFIATDPPEDDKKRLKKLGFDQRVIEEQDEPKRVWIIAADERAAEPRKLDIDGSVSALAWRPDGQRIAVLIAPSPRIDDTMMASALKTIDANSGAVMRSIEWRSKFGSFVWSPGGSYLALIAGEDLFDPAAGRLMIVPAEATAPLNVLPGLEGHVRAIAWQDNETCMFVASEGVYNTLGKVGASGAGVKTIVPPGGPVLDSLSLSRDGQSAAFVGETPAHAPEVYFMRHGDEAPRRLTDNNPWLADARLAPQEPIRYPARDGVEIDAILIRPLDAQPDTRYPLIVLAHGGPESHISNGWITHYHYPGQMAAARGFAVLYPNYRGSTGRGVAFSKLGQGDYGGREFDDIIDGIAHLDSIGLIDKERVGITGGSYGGYASAWGATKLSEHYAAAVMSVGISDHVSKFGTTDIPQEMYHSHAQTWPWENWDFFEERSPIRYVADARTPILIFHGEKDTRVHPSQSMSLFRYLKTFGQAPVRLVMYPSEGHGNQRTAARYDYCLRMLRWFEHYLQGPGGDPPPLEPVYDPAFVGEAVMKPDSQPQDAAAQPRARLRHATTIIEDPRGPAAGDADGVILETGVIEAPFAFNEAVVSWNIDAPRGAGFEVELCVGRNDNWSPWLFIGADAGPDGTAPAFEKTTSFAHGAVDIDYFRSNQAFDRAQLRVRRSDTGPTPRVARLAVCFSDTIRRDTNVAVNQPTSADATADDWRKRLDVPFRGQTTSQPELAGRICSPASVAMVLAYYGVDRPTEVVAAACFDEAHDIYGNWPRAIQAAYNLGAAGYLTRISDWRDVERHIAAGRPLIASIRVKKPGDLRGAPYETTDGHLIVITGFTRDGQVCVNDSAAADAASGRLVYQRDDLENVWMRGSGGLTYVLTPRDSTDTPLRATAEHSRIAP